VYMNTYAHLYVLESIHDNQKGLFLNSVYDEMDIDVEEKFLDFLKYFGSKLAKNSLCIIYVCVSFMYS
jgi:hypothetical protein